MNKYVRCTIRRSNHSGEMYDSSDRPIGFGYQGKSFQLNEGAEVCLPKDALYCFTDAVIEHESTRRDPYTKELITERVRIPRFNIDYIGFYVCDRECNNNVKNCNGREISRDEFFSDDPEVNERIFAQDIFKDKDKVMKSKKTVKPEEEIEDILS